ncbi:Ribulose-5-phosphate 4-epimerase and related epimerases and aldolases [uncultured Roseburia sp.]|uniref:Ankyrin repeat domain-containing protein n=1 Tax=Brotonthovivens ammoniilytica TaxID=2981725 RepID=A0ABT2TLZ0_9FIRM|nr:ankyrin repeat domain-containing protein [Brotonthovivens ammoniilytica]MCU6762539.1 ankyrin repeat domain-containing protein [Brotonthovivens ammoniilytica]SCI75118.1 Ribulose-5-phosphate 4-epimerase and related epimerases and aldolases [uncultured Roseburia sp.]
MESNEKLEETDQYLAAVYGNAESIQILEEKGTDFYEKGENRASILTTAVYNGNLETVAAMLEQTDKSKIDIQDFLQGIYQNDDAVLMDYLCEEMWVDASNISGSEIEIIVWENAESVLECLIKHGFKLPEHKEIGNQALVLAIQSENDGMLKFLLENGTDPNVKNEVSYPLVDCCSWSDPENINILLEHGADLELMGEEAMKTAVWAQNLDAVKILYENGVEITEECYLYAEECKSLDNNHTWEYVKERYEETM